MKYIKSSLFNRAPKLLAATLKLATGKDIDAAIEHLSELKGVPQKIGQLLSMDVTQYIPEEFKNKLKPLQSESKKFDHEILLAAVKKSLSVEAFLQITHFETSSIGAGSIGQVHWAMLDNRKVVFKIQYPDIEKTIHADIALLGPLASIYEFIRPDSKDLSILLKEAKKMILGELDYVKEANHLVFFKENLKHDDRFYVPEVLQAFSSEKIICMEYVEGLPLAQFIKVTKDIETKNKIAKALLELFIDEFFLMGKVQTDPNFGNYLIKDNLQIVLLDFGAVKDFNSDFRLDYFNLLDASYNGNKDKILLFGEKLGLVNRSDRLEAVNLFVSFMKDVLSYFHAEINPVDFKKEEITKKLLETGWKLWKEQRISSPHSDLVFLHRKLGGLFSLLKEMEVEIDLSPFWEKIKKFN